MSDVMQRRDYILYWTIIFFMAIPFCLLVLALLSYVCFGLGFAIPYMFLADKTELGTIPIAIYGTLIHAVIILLGMGLIKLDEIGELPINNLLITATSQMVAFFAYILIFESGRPLI